MATKPLTLLNGTTADADEVMALFDELYTNIDNSNIAAGAGIVFSKLDPATVMGVAAVQTVTGAKTFALNTLLIAGAGSGVATLIYANSANDITITLPDTDLGADITLVSLSQVAGLIGTQPIISDFTNAQHTHGSAAQGGTSIGPLTSLTAANNLDIGSFQLRAETFRSDVATGTAPLTIASTTKVTNLNADLLDDTSTYDGTNPVADRILITQANGWLYTPNSAPTANYHTANKKYVDDELGAFSIASNLSIFVTVGSDTFTVPSGVTNIKVCCIGGGGGGGGGGDNTNCGGGGGGGGHYLGHLMWEDLAVTPGDVIAYTIGAGGAGGAAGGTDAVGSDGDPGGTTSFGTITCAGGAGGQGGRPAGATGGAGVEFKDVAYAAGKRKGAYIDMLITDAAGEDGSSGGSPNEEAGDGGSGIVIRTVTTGASGDNGSDKTGGGGGSPGVGGCGYGAGGGGGSGSRDADGRSPGAGGDGSGGCIIIWY